jgi:hypothetical protein
MLNENSITDFKANLRGGVIEPGDKIMMSPQSVQRMIHKKPRLIVRCADVADVIRSVNFARDNDLLLAIRVAVTTPEAWEFAMMAWSSISHRSNTRELIQRRTPSLPAVDAHGAMSIMPRMCLGSPLPAESFLPPELVD